MKDTGRTSRFEGLLHRIWHDLLGGDDIIVLRPFRKSQGILLKEDGLKKAVNEVKIKLGPELPGGERKMLLILIDAEKGCPKKLAPKLVQLGDGGTL